MVTSSYWVVLRGPKVRGNGDIKLHAAEPGKEGNDLGLDTGQKAHVLPH